MHASMQNGGRRTAACMHVMHVCVCKRGAW